MLRGGLAEEEEEVLGEVLRVPGFCTCVCNAPNICYSFHAIVAKSRQNQALLFATIARKKPLRDSPTYEQALLRSQAIARLVHFMVFHNILWQCFVPACVETKLREKLDKALPSLTQPYKSVKRLRFQSETQFIHRISVASNVIQVLENSLISATLTKMQQRGTRCFHGTTTQSEEVILARFLRLDLHSTRLKCDVSIQSRSQSPRVLVQR